MRLGANRDVDDADVRSGRRRPFHAESRDWFAPDDVAPYSLPHRTRADGVQRPDDKTLRGYERRTMSLDTSQPTMRPPPRLARAATDAYRRPADIVVYEDEDNTSEDWRRSGQRPRTPEYRRPTTQRTPEHRRPSPVSIDGPDDCDEAEIEVIEELDADQLRRLRRREQHRHGSHDDYQDSSESRRRRRKIIPSSSEDEEVEARHRHSSPGRRSPVRRPVPRREASDSQRYGAPRVSVIESTRPPIASKRNAKVYEREVQREARPRQAPPQIPRQSRSSSRRPQSIIGSIFAGSSSRLASPERPTRYYECVVCMEEVPNTKCAKLKCGHRRCHGCLKRQFKLSTRDPQQMPPTCCSSDHISLRHVDKLFDLSFKKLWNRKFAEFSTRNRIYCPSERCGEWIKPDSITRDRESGRKMARCEYCKTRVCVSCNGKWHNSRHCPRDEETARFLEQAKEEGWKRCYRCKTMVELQEGCNHMTCRCGAEFCMICAAKWKNCDCPWFNYDSADDQLEDMNMPNSMSRGVYRNGYSDEPPSPSNARTRARSRPRRSKHDEEAPYRRPKAHREEDTRRVHEFGDEYEVYDPMGGAGDASGHYMNDHYRRGYRDGPPPVPEFCRSNSMRDHVAGVSRARGFTRLADRFSDSRQGSGPMEAPTPPPPQTTMMPLPMGMPPPPTMPSGPPPMYDMRGIIVERDPNEYGDEDSYGSHSSRGRKHHRHRGGTDTPKSSTLAGLSGRGVGMGRVDVWRKFVEPGDPEGEIAAAAVAAASA